MNILSKVIITITLTLWFSLTILDAYGYFFIPRDRHPVTWRAWEVLSNYTGKDANFTPFKPWGEYHGKLEGDLLNAANVFPKNKSRVQDFIVDEYGYRNPPNFLDEPIDAVVIGSSFVGGAAFSQDELISEILTKQYGIRTYNYMSSLQHAYEDEKFLINPPKYIIYLGQEGEVISSDWRYRILDRIPITKSQKWSSYDDWYKNNEQPPDTFEAISNDLRNYSLVRYSANSIHRYIINFGKDWHSVISINPGSYVQYDLESDMIYIQMDLDNPLLNSPDKTVDDIQEAIDVLNETQGKLLERDIKLVVAAMPSKTHAQLRKYRFIDMSQRALYHYNKQSEKNAEYINIDLLTPFTPFIQDKSVTIYYQDDSHWTGQVNFIIAREIAQRLCLDLPFEHKCHRTLEQSN